MASESNVSVSKSDLHCVSSQLTAIEAVLARSVRDGRHVRAWHAGAALRSGSALTTISAGTLSAIASLL